jgi:anti-sigma regulatory factor (Ser/Thr protein kinase)
VNGYQEQSRRAVAPLRTPGDAFTVSIDDDLSEIARMRAIAVAAGTDVWAGDEAARTDLLLVVSELVSNAMIHARPPRSMAIRLEPDDLYLAVEDGSEPFVFPAAAPAVIGGRGLVIVDRISSSWGIAGTAGGKAVWCRLPLMRPARS